MNRARRLPENGTFMGKLQCSDLSFANSTFAIDRQKEPLALAGRQLTWRSDMSVLKKIGE